MSSSRRHTRDGEGVSQMVFGCRERSRGLDTSAPAPKPTSRRHVRHTMSTVLTLTRAHYEGALVQPPHAHDALQISMLLTGRVEETVGGTTHDAAPLHVAVKDAGLEHANRWAEGGTTLLRLEAPGKSLASLTGHPTAPTWRWRFDPTAIRAFLRLAASVNAEGVIDGDTDGSDLLAALVAEPRDTPSGTPPRWLTDVIERLVAEWTPRLDTGVIATSAHVHPVYWPAASADGTAYPWEIYCAANGCGTRYSVSPIAASASRWWPTPVASPTKRIARVRSVTRWAHRRRRCGASCVRRHPRTRRCRSRLRQFK